MTFDYERAWLELALPAFKVLPNEVVDLLRETRKASDNLSQLRDTTMPWPEDGGRLRKMFEALSDEVLSNAARVVYFYGHWRPTTAIHSGAIEGSFPVMECTGWKFSHCADQILRVRFEIPQDSKMRVSFRIIEGAIRLCYSSRNSWQWDEVAMATRDGHEAAKKFMIKLQRKAGHSPGSDSNAYKFFEELKAKKIHALFDTSTYMIDESELDVRRLERMPKPNKERLIAELKSDFDKDLAAFIAKETVGRDGNIWLIEHDIPIENAIYYNHTGRWCFGWRAKISDTAKKEMEEKLAGFPFPYDFK